MTELKVAVHMIDAKACLEQSTLEYKGCSFCLVLSFFFFFVLKIQITQKTLNSDNNSFQKTPK